MTATSIATSLVEFQRAGIRNLSDLRTLIYLAGIKQATSSKLAIEINVSGATCTQVIDRLAARGLVTRHCTPNDRRLARITAAGRELVTPLLP